MKWGKGGHILRTMVQYKWVQTHGMLPVADNIRNDLFRINFSGRDISNRSRIGYIEIDINDPFKILCLSELPVLDLGKLGCFNDNGVTPTWMVTHDDKKFLYYFG